MSIHADADSSQHLKCIASQSSKSSGLSQISLQHIFKIQQMPWIWAMDEDLATKNYGNQHVSCHTHPCCNSLKASFSEVIKAPRCHGWLQWHHFCLWPNRHWQDPYHGGQRRIRWITRRHSQSLWPCLPESWVEGLTSAEVGMPTFCRSTWKVDGTTCGLFLLYPLYFAPPNLEAFIIPCYHGDIDKNYWAILYTYRQYYHLITIFI